MTWLNLFSWADSQRDWEHQGTESPFPIIPLFRNALWKKLLTLVMILLLSASLWFGFQAPAQANIFRDIYQRIVETFNPPPKREVTGRNRGAAGRGPNCPPVDVPVTALTPGEEFQLNPSRAGSAKSIWAVTVEAQPIFWFYVPYPSAALLNGGMNLNMGTAPPRSNSSPDDEARLAAKFMLLDEEKHPVMSQAIAISLSGTPGLISFRLPVALETGKLYNWYFSVVCNAQKPSRNPGVRGWIQRVAASPELVQALHSAAPSQRYRAYVEQGIWYEAVNHLLEHRRLDPTNETLHAAWVELLDYLGLSELAGEAIADCCT